jgi:hypothetical protein
MSKKFTYYGSKKSREYFLDLYPSEYYYSLNRGSVLTGDVASIFPSTLTFTAQQSFTAEELSNGTLSSFLSGDSGRLQKLFNQGFKGLIDIERSSSASPAAFVYDSGLFIFNNMCYILSTQTAYRGLIPNTVMDNNSTVYVVYRSQSSLEAQRLFAEWDNTANNRRIRIDSDTRSTTFNHSIYQPQGSPLISTNYTSQQPTTTLRVVAYRKTGNLVEVFDESGFVASAIVNDVFTNQTGLNLMSGGAGTNFSGYFGAVIVREQSDSNSTLNDIFDFLKLEYGI